MGTLVARTGCGVGQNSPFHRCEAVEVRAVRQGLPQQGLVQVAPAAAPRREALPLRRLQEGLHGALGAQETPQGREVHSNEFCSQ